jgi:hypothetical protein
VNALDVAKAVSALPLTMLLILVLVGGYVEWWVYGTIHRSVLQAKDEQIRLERERADQWQRRFLELNDKADATLLKATEIGHIVNGTAREAAEKLLDLEREIKRLRGLSQA